MGTLPSASSLRPQHFATEARGALGRPLPGLEPSREVPRPGLTCAAERPWDTGDRLTLRSHPGDSGSLCWSKTQESAFWNTSLQILRSTSLGLNLRLLFIHCAFCLSPHHPNSPSCMPTIHSRLSVNRNVSAWHSRVTGTEKPDWLPVA